MGGTTAKACVIADGEPLVSPEFEVDRRYHFKKGSGLPIKVPGHRDDRDRRRRRLDRPGGRAAPARGRAGERRAPAPAPSSYGLGGAEPTVTDADLVLGYLDPDFFLGRPDAPRPGRRRARHRRAGRRGRSGSIPSRPRGASTSSPTRAWRAPRASTPSSAARTRSAFPLFAFGGAGPVHAFGVARILRSPSVICPLGAGVMSAVGFLVAPLSFDFVRTLPGAPRRARLEGRRAARSRRWRPRAGDPRPRRSPPSDVRFRRFADMRYRKQGYEIRVPIPDGPLDASRRDEIRAALRDRLPRGLRPHRPRCAARGRLLARASPRGPAPDAPAPDERRRGPGPAGRAEGEPPRLPPRRAGVRRRPGLRSLRAGRRRRARGTRDHRGAGVDRRRDRGGADPRRRRART